MNFATWSIRNPVPVIVLFVLLTGAGIWGLSRLPIQDMPDVERPTVNVKLSQPGVAPAQLETEIARPVEDAIASLDRLVHLGTTLTEGEVSIRVEFELGKSLSDALLETKQAVDSIRSTLPRDMEEPTVSAVKVGGDAILIYAIASAKLDEMRLSWFVDDVVGKEITKIPGVGRFERVGGVDREVAIEVDPARLQALDVTALDVSRAVRAMQMQASGGRGQLGNAEQSVRVVALAREARDLKELTIVLPNGRHVRLEQLGNIRDGIADRSGLALLNGKPAIGFKIYPAKGADETRISAEADRVLAHIAGSHDGLTIDLVSGTVAHTQEQYDGSMHMLYEGAALAVIVVWLFLRDLRATFIAAIALPLSILPAFAAMSFLGYSLNTLTLLALAVTVGILVDDAIVEVENIQRHAQAGKSMRQAAGDAVTEIALAVFATTICLLLVFLPTTMMPGIPGLLFAQFGWTAIIAILASLLVARLLTPMMAAYLLVPGRHEAADGPLTRWYLAVVSWCLIHRKSTVAGAIVFFVGSMLMVPFIPAGLVPASDNGYTTINVEMAPGSSLDATAAMAEQVRRALDPVPGIKSVFAIVGDTSDSGDIGDVSKAAIILTLLNRNDRLPQLAVENAIRVALRQVPGARFSVGSGGLGERLELMLASEDVHALETSATAVERDMRKLPSLANITSTASLERPEIVIRPDTARAAELGVTTEEIGELVRIATSGDFDSQVGRLNLDSRQIYLRVRLLEAARTDPETFRNLRISGKGRLVVLSSVADIAIEGGPAQIDRFDRQRFVTIAADLGGVPLGTALDAVMSLPSVKALPSNVSFIEAGDAEIAGDLQSGFLMAIVVGIVSVFSVLVVLFKDVFQPVTILSAIPLSFGGALVMLLISGSELDVPSLIGIVMLVGVVTKNSILLVEYTVLGMQERGLALAEALLDACHKRARPIVMTSVAMIAGMAPIAAGFGADASFRQPMALAVIGGLLTSTVLSLVVVPVVFSYFDGFKRFVARLWQGGRRDVADVALSAGPAISQNLSR